MTTAHNTHEDHHGLWESPEAAEAWRRNAATRMRLLGPATERMLLLANISEGCHVLDITVEAIPLRYEYPSAAALMDARKETAGPLLTLIEQLSPADRERVWTEVAATLRLFEGPQGFAAPGEILLVRGSKEHARGSE